MFCGGFWESYKEDGQRVVVVVAVHVDIRLHASQSSISNVCPVEEGEEVQETQPWDEPEVDFPHQLAVLESKDMLEMPHS